MLKTTSRGNNQLEIEMSGKLDKAAMQIALDELLLKSEDIENGTLLYIVINYHLPTPSAIIHEFSRLPSMMGLLKKFKRAAVLTDTTWLKKASEFKGSIIPGLEIKVFALDERTEAEAWLESQD